MSISDNIRSVRARINAACERAGRDADSVTLIAVSKTKPVSDVFEAFNEGCADFGENRVQELCEKAATPGLPVGWHLIGHLQVNKAKYLPGVCALVHSTDSLKLALELDKQARKRDVNMDVLIEVNVAGEQSKFGVSPEDAPALALAIFDNCPNLRVRGLMTVAPKTDDPETNRPHFRRLKALQDEINALLPPEKRLDTLSMGMSGDFEVAIEEGATMVRVGTGVFGARRYVTDEAANE